MSDQKYLSGLETLKREHLEHVREFRLWINYHSAILELLMDNETVVSCDLEFRKRGFLYQRAVEAIVKVHMLWSGQKFEFHKENDFLVWRRV